MDLFDRVDRRDLDRRELHLLGLAIVSICMLAAGLALLAYPAVFSQSAVLTGFTSKICFFAFCGLSLLLVAYLWDHHKVVRRLRYEIDMERLRHAEYRFQAGNDLLSALPGFNQFQDRLVMEYRRASGLGGSFCVLVVKLTPAVDTSDITQITLALGDAVKAISHRLRREDSLYRFCADAIGIILPGLLPEDAKSVSSRLEEGLRDAAGAATRFSSVLKIFSYPQNASTAHELEMAVRSILPADLISEPLVDSLVSMSVDR
jgi:GGDEF domain-containing protein